MSNDQAPNASRAPENAMNAYAYKKIDAFASGRSTGNPAACLFLRADETLSEHAMQDIARQHKGFVSEVVYCRETGDGYELRYFSSECEVEFCGHGTIACMYSLIRNTPALLGWGSVAVRTRRKGVLTVFNEIPSRDAVFITAPEPVHIGIDPDRSEIARSLSLPVERLADGYPIDVIDAGLRTLIVPVVRLGDVVSVFPDEGELKAFCLRRDIDIVLVYSREVECRDHMAHTRVFAPRFGYLEDPATGSGNSAFGYYLLKNNLWSGEAASVEQGGSDRVFNTVKLQMRDGAVLFGGGAIDRIEGVYHY